MFALLSMMSVQNDSINQMVFNFMKFPNDLVFADTKTFTRKGFKSNTNVYVLYEHIWTILCEFPNNINIICI